MINLSDPLDRLRAANPVLPGDPSLPAPDPRLFHRIVSGEWTDLAPARRRRPRRLVPALLVVGLAGGATAYGLLRGEVTKPLNVACYAEADLHADTGIVDVDERGPVAACADLWRRGELGGTGEVPQLTACVLDSGAVGVFPTTAGRTERDVCATLNLPPVPSTSPPATRGGAPPPDANTRLLAFRDAVTGQFLDSPCVEPPAAAAIVRRELERAGLGDWEVRGGQGSAAEGFSPQRPCATLSIQPENKEVVLVPTPRR